MKQINSVVKTTKGLAHLLSRNLLSTAAVVALMGAATFAAAPAGGYLPGATLDPDCAPNDTDCIVQNIGTETDPLRKFVEGTTITDAIFTGGKVGIGADPFSTDTLTVVKENGIAQVGIQSDDGASDSSLVYRGLSGAAKAQVRYYPANDTLRLGTQGDYTTQLVLEKGGYVGVGTINPERPLHVVSTRDYPMAIQGTDTYSGLVLTDSTGSSIMRTINGDLSFLSGGAANSIIGSGAQQNVVIKASGNVGVGMVTPSEKLDVRDSVNASIQIGSKNLTGTPGTMFGSLKFWNADADIPGVMADIKALSGEAYAVGSHLAFSTSNTWGTSDKGILKERMRINQTGNVGIGTTTPSGKLHVEGSNNGNVAGRFINTSTTAYGLKVDIPNNTSSGYYILSADSGGTSKFMVKADGKVGIGKTVPTEKLDVGGMSSSVGTVLKHKNYVVSNTNRELITLLNEGTALTRGYKYKITLATRGTGTHTGAVYHVLETSPGVWVIKLESTAGLTSNHPQIELVGTAVQLFTTHGTDYGVGVGVEVSSVQGTGGYNNVSSIGLAGAITNLNGNVGIGTTSPSEKLEVFGGALKLSSSDDLHYGYIRSDATHGLYINSVGDGGGASAGYDKITYRGNEHHFLKSSGSAVMSILDDGKVGIGTLSPTSKLQVMGIAEYADNAAALAAGLTNGAIYRTGDLLKIVH